MGRLIPGDRIESLVVEQEIGRGAFGSVFRARDELIGRAVALKVVELPRHAPPEERARVLREARAVGRLTSPHIVTLYRVHEDEAAGRWLFEMEYLEGGTLAQLLRPPDPLPHDQVARHAAGMAAALDAAHRAGIIHGDVKPGNVLFDGHGRVKLADFGLSRLLDDHSLSHSTERFEGTPVYMAPEVILGQRASTSSDIWSFGVCLYFMLAGRLPFDARGLGTLFSAIQHADPPPLPRSAPPHLAALAMRCLEKSLARRPASFTEISVALEESRPPNLPASVVREPVAQETPLLGRAGELARIDEMVAAALAGTGGSLLLTGPQGIGRSSLARYARSRAAAGGGACIEATVTPLGGVLRPILEATRECIESGISGSLEDARFGSAGSIARRLLDEEASVKLESREQTLWALEQLLSQLAKEYRLLLVLEDLHEVQEEEAKVLDYLCRRVPAAGGLLIVTCRLDGRAPRGGAETAVRLASRPGIVQLALGPLTREEAYHQLVALAHATRVDPEVARRIHSVAEGNPLFAVELHRELAAVGAIAMRDGLLAPGSGWARANFPAKLLDLCTARLGRLSEEQRELLELAAVDGLILDGATLAELLGQPLIAILRLLQQVYRQHGILEPDRQGFRFANALYREALYRGLAPGLRRELHLQLARHLEGSEAAERDPERIGMHWEEGGESQRARRHLIAAATKAANRQELERAINLASRAGIRPGAIDLATALEHADLLIPLADCYHGSGQTAEGEEMLRLVMEASQDTPSVRYLALVQLAACRSHRRGISPEDERDLSQAAENLAPCRAKGIAHYLLGTLAKHRGGLEEAGQRFRIADELFVSIRLDALHSSALDQLASVALRGGRLHEARALYLDAARVSTHAGRRTNSAASRINAALATLGLGQLDGVGHVLEGCITELDLEGAENLASHARILLAKVRSSEGDSVGAEEMAVQALQKLERSEYLPGLSLAHAVVARLYANRGELLRADGHVHRALDAARRAQSHDQEANLMGLAALVAAWRGLHEDAKAAATRGLDLATQQGTVSGELVLTLAESALFAPLLPELERAVMLLEAHRSRDETLEAVAISLSRALISSEPDALERAAAALIDGPVAEGRATLRLFGGYLQVLASDRRGDQAAAYAHASHSRTLAQSLGHRWLEILILKALSRLAPDAAVAATWQRLRQQLSDDLESRCTIS